MEQNSAILLSFIVSFVAAVIIGVLIIPFLRRLKIGQSIYKDGPSWHMTKQGTPTMGGLIFIISIAIALAAVTIVSAGRQDYSHLFVFLFSLTFGIIGFTDDYCKIKKKQNLGLTALQKLVLQIAAAILFLTVMRYFGYLTPNLYIPYFNVTIPIPWNAYMILAAFIIVGCVNAVNLTDGVDGLVTGVTLPVSVFFILLSFVSKYFELGVFSAAMAGGLCAFLIFNFNPAKVFMGDTGSLFLGGAVCGLAFAYDIPLILIPAGIIYIAEAMSDIIQVAYFKLSGGKRIFKMAPLHHHFEMSGWKEKKIFFAFTLVSALGCAAALLGAAGRFVP